MPLYVPKCIRCKNFRHDAGELASCPSFPAGGIPEIFFDGSVWWNSEGEQVLHGYGQSDGVPCAFEDSNTPPYFVEDEEYSRRLGDRFLYAWKKAGGDPKDLELRHPHNIMNDPNSVKKWEDAWDKLFSGHKNKARETFMRALEAWDKENIDKNN